MPFFGGGGKSDYLILTNDNIKGGGANMALVSGVANMGLGVGSLLNITSGDYNIAIGKNALNALTVENYNLAIGDNAGATSTNALGTADNNIFLGYNNNYGIAHANATVSIGSFGGITFSGNTLVNCVGIGFGALRAYYATNTVAVGDSSGYSLNGNMSASVFVGQSCGSGGNVSLDNTVGIGQSALSANLGGNISSTYSVAIGQGACESDATSAHTLTLNNTVAIGKGAGWAVGADADLDLTNCILIGPDTMASGPNKIVIGNSQTNVTIGAYNLATIGGAPLVTASSTNAAYPLVLSKQNTTGNNDLLMDVGVTINPSTGALTLGAPLTAANGGSGAASLGLAVDAATAKTTPVAADELLLADSAASFATKKVTLGNLAPNLAIRGAIAGLGISYSSTTAIVVAAGNCTINGATATFAGATLTSGSTMMDLNNAIVNLGASKAYHVYLWNNGGAPQIAVQNWSDGTYGGTPVYDVTNDYYEAAYAAVGVNARRIGVFHTNSSSNILKFNNAYGHRTCKYELVEFTSINILFFGNSATLTSIGTLTPYILPDIEKLTSGLIMQGTNIANILLSLDGTNNYKNIQNYLAASGLSDSFIQFTEIPYKSTIYYSTGGSSASLYVSGLEFVI